MKFSWPFFRRKPKQHAITPLMPHNEGIIPMTPDRVQPPPPSVPYGHSAVTPMGRRGVGSYRVVPPQEDATVIDYDYTGASLIAAAIELGANVNVVDENPTSDSPPDDFQAGGAVNGFGGGGASASFQTPDPDPVQQTDDRSYTDTPTVDNTSYNDDTSYNDTSSTDSTNTDDNS